VVGWGMVMRWLPFLVVWMWLCKFGCGSGFGLQGL
jgi:hypothetical protein